MKTYKFIRLLLCFVAFTTMMSCNKDNVDSNNVDEASNASIVGTWGCLHSYYHSWGTYDGEPYDHENTDNYIGFVVNFKDDGTYTSSANNTPFYTDGGSWMKNDNTLIINNTRQCEIQMLNNTDLKIKYHYSFSSGVYIGETDIIYEFKRQ